MREKKYYLAIDDHEYSIVINSLNGLRNKLIATGKYANAVDELIVKFAKAPIKKFKIKRTEDYYLPNLALPAEGNKFIGIWGQRHARYLKQYRKVHYYNLLTSGKLNGYLADINEQAEDMFLRLVKQMAEREGVTEQLKAENQMVWVGRMNNIRSRAAEIVNSNLIDN